MSVDDLVDVLGRPRQDVGARHPQGVGVGQEARPGSARSASPIGSPAAAAPRMILSSTSVMFITQRDRRGRASAGGGRAGRRRGTTGSCRCGRGRRPSVRTSRCGSCRRAAARAGGSRRTACRGAGRSLTRRLDRGEGQRRDRPTGALGTLEVAGRRLDADRARSAGRGAPRSRRASRRGGRRAAGGRRRSSGRCRPDASRPRASRPTTVASRTPLSMPVGVAGPAGNMRPRSPRPAAPSSASATAWRATSPSE